MPGASHIGDLTLIVPGVTVWSSTRRYGDMEEGPVGGVVIETTARPDPDTGEAVRQLRVIDPYRLRPTLTYHVLDETDVDRNNLEVPYTARLTTLVRVLCGQVHKGKGNILTGLDARHVRDAHLLLGAAMGQS